MSVIQKEEKNGIIITKTIENGQINGPYTEDWGTHRIQGQMKDGKPDGVFYRFNTDKYHTTPELETMTIYENGQERAYYSLNRFGQKHGPFSKLSQAGDRIEGCYEKDALTEETVYNRNTKKPTVKRQYNKDQKITTFYTKDGLPMRQTTINQDGSRIVENFDSHGNVSTIINYDCNGILKNTSQVPPPPEMKKEKKIEHESRIQDIQKRKRPAGLSGYLFDIVEQCRQEIKNREKQSQKQQEEQEQNNVRYHRVHSY